MRSDIRLVRPWIKHKNERGKRPATVMHKDVALDKPPEELADLDIEQVGAGSTDTTGHLVEKDDGSDEATGIGEKLAE